MITFVIIVAESLLVTKKFKINMQIDRPTQFANCQDDLSTLSVFFFSHYKLITD